MKVQEQGSYATYKAAASDDWIVLHVSTNEIIYQGLETVAEHVFQTLVASEQLPHFNKAEELDG